MLLSVLDSYVTSVHGCHSEYSEASWRLQEIPRRVAPDDSGVEAAVTFFTKPVTTLAGGGTDT